VQQLELLIKNQYQNSVELFIHIDSCKPTSCYICAIDKCPVRQHSLEGTLVWTLDNVLKNKQHNA
jgi:hypothetical protein